MLNKRTTITVAFVVVIVSRCAYFNTFYNAQSYYRQAKKQVAHDTLMVDSEYFDKTIEKATSVIVKYPRSRYVDDALFMMGTAYYFKGDYSRALEKLDFLCLNYPESKFCDDAIYFKGLAFYKQKRYGQAIVALKEAVETKAFRTKAMSALCYVYFKQNDYVSLNESAQALLSERLDAKDKRWVLYLLGESQYNEREYTDALTTFTNLLNMTRKEEDKRKIKLSVAQIYLDMGEYEKCKQFLAGESDAEFQSILADLNVELGNIEQAKQIYLEVGTHGAPDFAARAFYKMAELYRLEDSLDWAIVFYDSSVAHSQVNEYAIKSKKMANVLRRMKTLLEETEDLDRAQFLLAEMYYVDFDEPERAVLEYEKVYMDYPESVWAPKALYARLWITHESIQDSILVQQLATHLLDQYQNSDYSESARHILSMYQNERDEEESNHQE
jgi:TolA-binding protein